MKCPARPSFRVKIIPVRRHSIINFEFIFTFPLFYFKFFAAQFTPLFSLLELPVPFPLYSMSLTQLVIRYLLIFVRKKELGILPCLFQLPTTRWCRTTSLIAVWRVFGKNLFTFFRLWRKLRHTQFKIGVHELQYKIDF